MTAERGLSALQLYSLAGDRLAGVPLAEAVVREAGRRSLPLALVRRGIAGLGRGGQASDLLVAEARPDLQPVVIRVLGSEAQLLDLLAALLERGLPDRRVTLEG